MSLRSVLSKYSPAAIERFLTTTRKKEIDKLNKKKQKLLKDLAEVETQIGRFGGSGSKSRVGRPRGTRARNDKPLADVLADVLGKNGKAMKVSEIAEAVLATGYNTNSPNFRSIVNQTLIKDRKRFDQAERSYYQLKK
jgi:hypothetical protein